MDATEGMKKAIAERKKCQAYSLKQLENAVKESRANRHKRMVEPPRQQ